MSDSGKVNLFYLILSHFHKYLSITNVSTYLSTKIWIIRKYGIVCIESQILVNIHVGIFYFMVIFVGLFVATNVSIVICGHVSAYV